MKKKILKAYPVADFEFDARGKYIMYEGNPQLKPAGCQINFTTEHMIEIKRCKDDIVYFAENYYHIVNLDDGLIKIKLRGYQKKILRNFENYRHNIVLASRQCGKSTMYEIFLTHYILFNEQKSAVILANKEKTAVSLMGRVMEAYQHLPKWLQSGVKGWGATKIVLENGSNVTVSSTASSAVRGMAVNLLILDEMAFVPKNIWDAFYASVYPTISSAKTTKIIMVSTPNGKNHFYKMWYESKNNKDNTFHPTRVTWQEVPGRDGNWERETRANIGDQRFEQEFNISFLGSSNTLVGPNQIEAMAFKKPIQNLDIHGILGENAINLDIYRKPRKGNIYSIGVDTSKMCEEIVGDATAVQVLDITRLPFKQVATFYAQKSFSYYEAPEVIDAMGKYYNNGTAFIENNEIGQSIADSLWLDYEYEAVFFEKGNLPGFRTTKKTKRAGCTNLRAFIENGKLDINDFETISQISTFVKVKNSYKAEVTYSDDAVLALIAALFFLQVPQYNHFDDRKKFLEKLIKKKEKTLGEDDRCESIEDDITPFGFYGDSLDNDSTEKIF